MIPNALLPRAQSACSSAIQLWGTEPQLRQAQEELCECSAAINRMLRQRDEGWAQLVEETADVAICLVQLRQMLGPEVDRMIEVKLARLEARLAESGSQAGATK